MRVERIEKTLKGLSAPEPPADLKKRCLATIPDAIETAGARPWWSSLRRRSLHAAIFMGASLVLAVALATLRPSGISGAEVLAASVEAMKSVPYWHEKGREVGMYPDGGGRDGDGWYSGRWVEDESWFDAEYGSLNESSGTTFAHQLRLDLPNGKHYERLLGSPYPPENRLVITDFGPGHWTKARAAILANLMELNQRARGFNYDADPKLVTTNQGLWKGRRATVITFEAPPPREKAARGAPTVRTVFYVDPETRLCMAQRQWAVSARTPEHLVEALEFDYDRRPDRSLFDPRRLEEGATSVIRQKGRPGVIVSP